MRPVVGNCAKRQLADSVFESTGWRRYLRFAANLADWPVKGQPAT